MTEPTPPRGPFECGSCGETVAIDEERVQCYCGRAGHRRCVTVTKLSHRAGDHAAGPAEATA